MSQDGGFIRVYRRVWDNPVFCSKAEAGVFLWMVGAAAWKDYRLRTQYGPIDLKVGEVLIAERVLAEDFAIHRNGIRKLLARMVSDGMITILPGRCPHRLGTVVAINNYKKYQSISDDFEGAEDRKRTERGPQEDRKRTATGPEEDRNGTEIKEVKEKKEGKEGNEEKIQEATPPGADAPLNPIPPPKNARDLLWENGVPLIRYLTGKPDGQARTLLGKMCKDARNDCSRVMSILQEAQSMHPLMQAEAWLTQAARGGGGDRPKSRLAGLRERQEALERQVRGEPAPVDHGYDIELTAEKVA